MPRHRALLIYALPTPDPYHTQITPNSLTELFSAWRLDVSLALTAEDVSDEALAGTDLVVLWILVGPGCEAAFARIVAQVAQGTPLLCLHTALWCAGPCGQAEAIGGSYQAHPPYQPFQVQIDHPDHAIVAGVDAFEIIDEPYQLECTSDVTVLAHADGAGVARLWRDQGGTDPWQVECDAWTRSHAVLPLVYLRPLGRGWVVAQALGHDAAAMAHPAWQRITSQAVRWLLPDLSHFDVEGPTLRRAPSAPCCSRRPGAP